MKNFFQKSAKLVAAAVLGLMAQSSFASHFQGGDLTYQCVAPGTYVINTKIYRDCTGATAPTQITLDLKPQGCAGGRSVTVQRTGLPTIGNPYCPSIPQTCSTVRANYEEVRFSTTITFTAAEIACPGGMIVSCTNNARPAIANLVNPQGDIYAEAFINLGSINGVGINNNSPEFSPLNVPIPFVCVGQDTRYSLNAAEQDGDSLFYELAPALSAANTPYTYGPITGAGQTGQYFPNPAPPAPYCNNCTPPNPQFGYFAGAPITNFSPTYPLPSYNANWNAINPATGIPFQFVAAFPYFELAQSGELRFRPAVHFNTPPVQGDNKYAVVVKITEYRKNTATGAWVKVGFIRRDILFIVEDCGGNTLPKPNATPAPPKFNAQFKNDTVYNIQTCNTTPIRLHFVDPDTADKLTITVNPADLAKIPNSQWTLKNNGSKNVNALLYITPAVTEEGKDYLLPMKIEDNSCPIKGVQNLVIRIHVMKRDLAFVVGNQTRTICRGESTKLNVDVNRPDSLMSPLPVVATSKNEPATYTYEWTPAPGLNQGDLDKKEVTVTPTATTRYYVKVKSTFSGCYDTTSVLVKIQEKPEIKDIQIGYTQGTTQVRFGSAVKLTPIMGGDTTGYHYLWTPSKTLFKKAADADVEGAKNDSTSFSVWAAPLKTQDYTLRVTTKDGMCSSEKTFTVVVADPFLPNIITPNNDGKNDKFIFRALIPNSTLQIYNRWGVQVKEYKSYDNSFDGSGVSDGTYYYILKEPTGKSFKGWFEIVR